MPGPMTERPRAQRLTDIEPHHSNNMANNPDDDGPVSAGSSVSKGKIKFPKLDECAHFHYEHVELNNLEVSISEVSDDSENYAVRVTSGDACWTLLRTYDNFVTFDDNLHRCIYDRKFSSLCKLSSARPDNTYVFLKEYLEQFSQLSHEGLNCGPVLNWLQLDNRGRRIFMPESESCPINTPAVAAAYAVRAYTAQAQDEISFQKGNMISVIDMPPPGESSWWRGKHGFAVGFFPADCVELIGDKVPRHLTISPSVRSKSPMKPVLRKHGKLIAFFRSFILNRPSRRRLKQSGILKERVFGCDLGEHLLNSGHDVPTVLTCCTEFIESHGLVDGVYRLSGVTSNINKLRNAFDEDRVPALVSDESILQDIHSVASLLKMYFRELPNPLCTYQLYSTFVNAVQAPNDAERLKRMRDAVRKLPPPHYRTLEYLMRHLVRVASRGEQTGMTPRNVAIVWAPNLLRCKELEVGGVAALKGVGVQAVVTEFLICYADLIFGEGPVGRPKSLAITTPSRLLSLEEARNRSVKSEQDYIEVGPGPAGLPPQYHTVIELPRKRNGSKRSPSLNWRALFGRGALGTRGKPRQISIPVQVETVPNSRNSYRRVVKSADSLDGDDSFGPLLGPPPVRTCGHSRSVSHDSYFDHLTDGPSASSPLDLSEIQLNFDLEEREMRMFSEEESTGIASVEASPRRQRAEGPQSVAMNGASKRKRSRLEERLHCDVELRFIDSQSPDQVMVADIHSIESPSPLPTPGYLPLLSEASTPITPATTLRETPLSISPVPTGNSPRISFRSFTLPLELDDELRSVSVSSRKTPDPSQRLSATLNIDLNKKDSDKYSNESSARQSCIQEMNIVVSECVDQEMTPCDTMFSICSGVTDSSRITSPSKDTNDTSASSSERDSFGQLDDTKQQSNKFPLAGASGQRTFTDLDSPMSCEQTLEDLPDSGFVICDSSEKIFTTTTDTQPLATNNDSGEWVIVERTATSVTTPSESIGFKDPAEGTVDPAIATDTPLARSASGNISRTSLDFTMGSIVDSTDTSCIGTSDFTESPVLAQESAEFDVNECVVGPIGSKSCRESKCEDDTDHGVSSSLLVHSSLHLEANNDSHQSERTNENDKPKTIETISSSQMEEDSSFGVRIDAKNSSLTSNHDQDNQLNINNKENRENQSTERYPQFDRPILVIQPDFCDQKRSSSSQSSPSEKLSPQRRFFASPQKNPYQPQYSLKQKHSDNVVIASEHAAEPHEVAHVPENASETTTSHSIESFSNVSSPVDDSVVLRDTASVLQELALQHLSGGTTSARRRYESESRRSFDSEIGREIVRERKMRQELENVRKSEELQGSAAVSHVPPCLRARHARSTRASLSRSLDEGKFNQMTAAEPSLSPKTNLDDSQHSSTPNVGASSHERSQSRNLGGLDLGDPRCRERIEKYKEERRSFLRDKYRSESFRGSLSKAEDDDQALLARLKQRASRPSLH